MNVNDSAYKMDGSKISRSKTCSFFCRRASPMSEPSLHRAIPICCQARSKMPVRKAKGSCAKSLFKMGWQPPKMEQHEGYQPATMPSKMGDLINEHMSCLLFPCMFLVLVRETSLLSGSKVVNHSY
jgi:hypothetical protein